MIAKQVLDAVNDKAKELGGNIEIVEYTRFEVGEGLEKKEENFAEEVAKQIFCNNSFAASFVALLSQLALRITPTFLLK